MCRRNWGENNVVTYLLQCFYLMWLQGLFRGRKIPVGICYNNYGSPWTPYSHHLTNKLFKITKQKKCKKSNGKTIIKRTKKLINEPKFESHKKKPFLYLERDLYIVRWKQHQILHLDRACLAHLQHRRKPNCSIIY